MRDGILEGVPIFFFLLNHEFKKIIVFSGGEVGRYA